MRFLLGSVVLASVLACSGAVPSPAPPPAPPPSASPTPDPVPGPVIAPLPSGDAFSGCSCTVNPGPTFFQAAGADTASMNLDGQVRTLKLTKEKEGKGDDRIDRWVGDGYRVRIVWHPNGEKGEESEGYDVKGAVEMGFGKTPLDGTGVCGC